MSSERPTSPSRIIKPSLPIPIATRGPRGRSGSLSSASSGSASSQSELQTPLMGPATSQPIVSSPGSSPILSYFMSQSPKVTAPSTFPFRKFGASAVAPPVFEEGEPQELPATAHARRASTVVAGRLAQTPSAGIPEPHMERGAGFLRRLSLSGAGYMRSTDGQGPPSPPRAPPPSAVSPTATNMPFSLERKPRRSATISVPQGRPRRAPSPMGERILKGHFDGFN